MVLVIVSKSVCDSKLKHINTQCLAAICAHVLPYQNENLQHEKKTERERAKEKRCERIVQLLCYRQYRKFCLHEDKFEIENIENIVENQTSTLKFINFCRTWTKSQCNIFQRHNIVFDFIASSLR